MDKFNKKNIDSQIEDVRNVFEEKEAELKRSIIVIYGEVQMLSEEEFIKKLVKLKIKRNLLHIDILHNLAHQNPDLLEVVNKLGKDANMFDRLTILEQIDGLASKTIELGKNGFPAEQKEEYLELYRLFKAMSIEDLDDYIRNRVYKLLEKANNQIAAIEQANGVGR